MHKQIRKFETTMWLFIKAFLYIQLLFIFMTVLGKENIGLVRLSRTMGITVSTFLITGLLFLSVYGRFDVGRRKSKPIIYSLGLAVFCTDIITYLQLMIMRTNVQNYREFRLTSLGLLGIAFLMQIVLIIGFVYAGNWLFFVLHEPEKCVVITSSQKSLDEISYAMQKFQKQYKITHVLDYRRTDLKPYVREADTVFMYDVPVESRTDILRWSYRYKVNVYFNPEIEDIMELNATQYVIDDIYLFNKNVKALTMEQRVMKRLLDLSLSAILGVLSSPLWILGAIVVKAYDGGPILFKQERATINGNRFWVYKLRTMKVGVENKSVTKGDKRITKPGAFLRKTRIDELPQLWNVFKGDMTFVGPRPEMMENVKEYTEELPEFKYRLRMKAGLTGYAQIAGKYNTTPKDKLVMDMMYIEQFSILKDLQLIFQTAIVLLKKDSTEAFDRKKYKSPYQFEPVEIKIRKKGQEDEAIVKDKRTE